VPELAVGANRDDTGETDSGAVWILFLTAQGTVKSHVKIAAGVGGLDSWLLSGNELFGSALATLELENPYGGPVLAVGAPTTGTGEGSVRVLFLHPSGAEAAQFKVKKGSFGFTGDVEAGDQFGGSLAWLGKLSPDGDGVLAVGADNDDDGGADSDADRGAVWLLSMETPGLSVTSYTKISATSGGFDGSLADGDHFGTGLGSLGDLDGDGVPDLGVGAYFTDSGATANTGALWLVVLNPDGTVLGEEKIGNGEGGFPSGLLGTDHYFGNSVLNLGDLDGDSITDLAIGAYGHGEGRFYIVNLEGCLECVDGAVAPEGATACP